MQEFSSFSKRLFGIWYDTLNRVVEGRLRPYRQETAGQACGEILEIGGGTGANLEFYPADARLTIIEPNRFMAKRLISKANTLKRPVNVISSIGENLPFHDATFDSIVTTLVLCMVEDLKAVLFETHRVLKPGGAFFFYEHVISPRTKGQLWQNLLNPTWKRLTTGCNLNRDITGAIDSSGFSSVNLRAFDLSVGIPLTIPTIVGMAKV